MSYARDITDKPRTLHFALFCFFVLASKLNVLNITLFNKLDVINTLYRIIGSLRNEDGNGNENVI